MSLEIIMNRLRERQQMILPVPVSEDSLLPQQTISAFEETAVFKKIYDAATNHLWSIVIVKLRLFNWCWNVERMLLTSRVDHLDCQFPSQVKRRCWRRLLLPTTQKPARWQRKKTECGSIFEYSETYRHLFQRMPWCRLLAFCGVVHLFPSWLLRRRHTSRMGGDIDQGIVERRSCGVHCRIGGNQMIGYGHIFFGYTHYYLANAFR